ncbi:hypothetical protein J717_1237 [Acinetobacter baumannii 121738]|nr:hypothetical protein J717_4083 [Acinetobacter baumannii 121738]EXG36269.1 hypothetical protein J717_1237 [Acinetobacter baumannii 121738]
MNPQFLNHLCDEQRARTKVWVMFYFLNHLCDEQPILILLNKL